ncbi:hypothetical protein [Streptomyces resistomycificus]|nr:hypothetical protein [Streptomyces resistomycificus]
MAAAADGAPARVSPTGWAADGRAAVRVAVAVAAATIDRMCIRDRP